ncbi:MAG: DJ-1/PfpI family protein [Rhodopila sp.]|nr:DJ-1/PfpI family protein [Rhodopila sp.]
MTQYRIGLLAFPAMTQLDLTGPLQVFASLPGAEVHVLWKTLDPIQTQGGLRLLPDSTLADCPKLDVICVPGGAGVLDLMDDPEVLAFLRTQAAKATFVGSICTGSLVLGAAGLLRGKKATTHWAWTDLLVPFGAIPTKGRVVRDGKFMSGGGVTAGIDFALTMVAELAGREVAESIQLGIEYAPAPPFDAGSPDTARPELVTAVRARMAGLRAEREARVAKAAAVA